MKNLRSAKITLALLLCMLLIAGSLQGISVYNKQGVGAKPVSNGNDMPGVGPVEPPGQSHITNAPDLEMRVENEAGIVNGYPIFFPPVSDIFQDEETNDNHDIKDINPPGE